MQVLVIGAGEVGYHTALRLSHEGHKVVVVDRNQERIRQVQEQMDVQAMVGLGSSPKVLETANLGSSDLVVCVTDSDEVNLTACRFAAHMAPGATRIARIRNTDYLDFIEANGAGTLNVDAVINPEREVARQIEQFLVVPATSSVTDFAGGKVKLLGLRIPATSDLAGKKLMEARPAGAPKFLVTAIEREGRIIIPRGDDTIFGGDLAYVVVTEDQVDPVIGFFGLKSDPVKNIIVVGGGAIGRLVVQKATARGIKSRLIDNDEARCERLVDELQDVMVLHGDGTDLSLLKEENIGAADVFAAVTNEEEDNILMALLAKKMGANRVIARVAHLGYVPLVSSLGIEMVVSPRFAAVGAILRYLRRGKVFAVAELKDDGAEVIEVEAQATSKLVGRPLAEVKMPQGALVAAVMRDGSVEIASGQTIVHPGDRLVIFLLRPVLAKVEKLLTVSLEFF